MQTLVVLIHLSIDLLCFVISGSFTFSGLRTFIVHFPAMALAVNASSLSMIFGITVITMAIGSLTAVSTFYIVLLIKMMLGPVPVGVHSRHSLSMFHYLLLEHLGRGITEPGSAFSWLTNRHYRQIGLKVPYSCGLSAFHVDFSSCDHITIGERTHISSECNFHTTEIAGDSLIVGKITIGSDCHIGKMVDMDCNSSCGDGVSVTAKDVLLSNHHIPTPKDYVPRKDVVLRPTGLRAVYQFTIQLLSAVFLNFFGAAVFGSLFYYMFTGKGYPIFTTYVVSMFMEQIFMVLWGNKFFGWVSRKCLVWNFEEVNIKVDSYKFVRYNEAILNVNKSKFHYDAGSPWSRFLYWSFGWDVGKYSLLEECGKSPLPGLSTLGEATCHGASNDYTNSTQKKRYV